MGYPPEPRWQPEVAGALSELAEHLPAATVGKMFGYPALYVAGKLSACAHGDGTLLLDQQHGRRSGDTA